MLKGIVTILLLATFIVNAKAPAWEQYAKLPMVEQPSLSPNGELIATLYNTDSGPTISVTKFPDIDFKVLARLKKNKDRVDFIRWSGNRYIIVSASYPEYVNGQFFRVSRLYSINVETSETKVLTSPRFTDDRWYKYQSFELVSSLKDETDYALISTYDKNDKGYVVYRVHLGTSDFDKVQGNKNDIGSWYADSKGVIRLGLAVEEKDDVFTASIWYRANKDAELKKIHSQVWGEDDTFSIQALSKDGSKAYVLSNRELGREALWLYNIEAGKFEELIFSNDKYDLDGAITDNEGEFIGVSFFDDYYRTHYFDDKDGAQEREVAGLFKGKQATISSRSRDHTRLLVSVTNDVTPPTYYYFDLNTQKGGVWLSKYPYLVRKSFSPVQNYSFKASDGLEITGYFTQPANVKNPPLIVMPHGGPHARDYKYFDKELQYLVELGFSVLQVNFRGSAGFGSAFETAGYYQWGKRMQQDVYEAMDWAIAQGLAKKDNACIFGASYGGYVALTAAFQEPKRFKCVVSISGVSDLETFVTKTDRQGKYLGNIVDVKDDKSIDALAEVSAIRKINHIKAPILLIHGNNDTRVNYNQSKDFYDKARKQLDIKYVEIEDGTHFFDDQESQVKLFSEITPFLKKHLL
ncbi:MULTISPECIES: alpha/beta fold hydrolase [Pseudoalteromonas]|uniref:alpha/beta hydrolase family protein n=1 Tax=Pseudoalteromonas TaxID=53246 RepID=UPI000A4895A4|nr:MULTISPECIES: alpha/beta fold hydrolase [Pseudoalteromonas]MCF7517408.1 alpha/beta fold hydrolase [Pseudoalteromonas sp. L21]UJX25065.1 alpha/beta fold hydrolase [Pseudoalteromonas sp. CF6-2]|tara:strand:+ start:3306 stop:5210 length:1905 start_codon:yes stop_codon:yes gene_type:complete